MEDHFYFGTFSRTHKVSLSSKQLTLFIAIDKTQAFKQKIRILENLCVHHYKLNSFLPLRHCSEDNKIFLILYNKMCQH